MSMLRLFLGALVATQLAACANFTAVREFGQETDRLTSATAAELAFVTRDCAQVAQARRVVEGADIKGANCDKLEQSIALLARNTNDVLALYGKTLLALADGAKFDYSQSLTGAKNALIALKDGTGATVMDKSVADAASAIADLLLKVATEQERRAAVRRMMQEAPALKVISGYLRSFFASPDAARSSYGLQIAEDDAGLKDLQASLKALARLEPIRAREWQDDIAARRSALAKRAAGDVARSTAEAIEAWQQSLDAFVAHAFAPDAREWRDQVQVLRAKASAAKSAIDAL